MVEDLFHLICAVILGQRGITAIVNSKTMFLLGYNQSYVAHVYGTYTPILWLYYKHLSMCAK